MNPPKKTNREKTKEVLAGKKRLEASARVESMLDQFKRKQQIAFKGDMRYQRK